MTDLDLAKLREPCRIHKSDRWCIDGFNRCRVIVVHDGPDENGRTYVDGRHVHTVAVFEDPATALRAVAMFDALSSANERADRYRKALEFYARPANWRSMVAGKNGFTTASSDGGKRARSALGEG